MLATIPNSDIVIQTSVALVGTFPEVGGTQREGEEITPPPIKLGHKKSY